MTHNERSFELNRDQTGHKGPSFHSLYPSLISVYLSPRPAAATIYDFSPFFHCFPPRSGVPAPLGWLLKSTGPVLVYLHWWLVVPAVKSVQSVAGRCRKRTGCTVTRHSQSPQKKLNFRSNSDSDASSVSLCGASVRINKQIGRIWSAVRSWV